MGWQGAPVDDLECRHLDPVTEGVVRDWFSGRLTKAELDGGRSVLLARPDDPTRMVKIKGAGLRGGPIQWQGQRNSGPRHPVFDFDGRMSEDVAFGHDAALPGGATLQQVATEWAVTRELAAAGEDVVPCLGYGRIRGPGDKTSWFSVFDMQADWIEAVPPAGCPMDLWRELVDGHARDIVRLARDHGLIGYFWHVTGPDGRRPIKDVHPFRRADPLSMSAVSWVLAVYFGIHIRCNQIEFSGIPRWDAGLPPDAYLWPLQSLVPGITVADHARLRAEIVAPYIVRRPDPFDGERLWRLICGHPVTAALLDLCPPEFARP